MKTKVSKLVMSAVIALAAMSVGAAHAVTSAISIEVGKGFLVQVTSLSFSDLLSFSLVSPSNVSGKGGPVSINFAGQVYGLPEVTFTGYTLSGGSLTSPVTHTFSGALPTTFSFTEPYLGVGNYLLQVSGTSPSSSTYWGGLVNAAPVPEPGEWALMLSGLGMLGFMIRRRTQKVA
jgi:hypothetical protein